MGLNVAFQLAGKPTLKPAYPVYIIDKRPTENPDEISYVINLDKVEYASAYEQTLGKGYTFIIFGQDAYCDYDAKKSKISTCKTEGMFSSLNKEVSTEYFERAISNFCKKNSLRNSIEGSYMFGSEMNITFLSSGDFVIQKNNNSSQGSWKISDKKILLSVSDKQAPFGTQLCSFKKTITGLTLNGCKISGELVYTPNYP